MPHPKTTNAAFTVLCSSGALRVTVVGLALAILLLILGMSVLPDRAAVAGPGSGDANRSGVQTPGEPVQADINEALLLARSQVVALHVPALPGQGFALTTAISEVEDGRPITIDLAPYSNRAANFRVRAQLDDGSLVEIDAGPDRAMRGTILEVPGSIVAATLESDGLHAMVILPDSSDLLWIEPVAAHLPDAPVDPSRHVVYRSSDAACKKGVCGVKDKVIQPHALRPAAPPDQGGSDGGIAGLTCESVLIGIDVDFAFVQIWGGETNALNRVNNVMNNTNAIYESQVGIIHLISEIIVRTSEASNPYTCTSGSGSAGNLLGQFANVWTSVPESQIPRNVAHLFTGCTSINAAGIANLGGANVPGNSNFGVCRPNHYGLTVHQGSLSCTTHVAAHELGHNWSAQHCDGTAGCSGTIMPAFFPPCSSNFSTFSQNQILNHKNHSTFGACTVPCQGDPPQNDACPSSINVLAGDTPISNLGATTTGPAEPQCDFAGDSQIHSDVWYRHTAQCTGTLFVRLCNSPLGIDTKLAVYNVTCPTDPGTAIACNQDFCGQRSAVTIQAVAGETYRIRVGSHDGAQGNLVLTVVCVEDPEPDPCPGDLTGDGNVGVSDLLQLLSCWGQVAPGDCENADLTGDGNVGVSDLLALLSEWGECPE